MRHDQKYPFALFDIKDNKNSASVITQLQEKIKDRSPSLTPVVTAENSKYYVLRTEKAIFENTTKISLLKNGEDIGTITLKNLSTKNIKGSAKNKFWEN